jgi:hypothetical protein
MFTKFIKAPQRVVTYLKQWRDVQLVRKSGLFNEAWYLFKNPDVARAEVDPLLHYLQTGAFEGRDPSPYFSSSIYLNIYKDVKEAGVNPLLHYLKYGQVEGREKQPAQ